MNKKKLKIIAVALPIVGIVGAVILKTNIDFFVGLMPKYCMFLLVTGYQCPACGNTRSVLALLRGDIIGAVKFNPTVPILLLVMLIAYIELCTAAFGKKHIKILPRGAIFWAVVCLSLGAYYLLRNIL